MNPGDPLPASKPEEPAEPAELEEPPEIEEVEEDPAEEDAADRLVMRLPRLGLLRGGMHVAEAALKRAVVEDRRSTGV